MAEIFFSRVSEACMHSQKNVCCSSSSKEQRDMKRELLLIWKKRVEEKFKGKRGEVMRLGEEYIATKFQE